MSVTYDTLLSDTQLIQYTATAPNTNLYPDSNTIAITGPIWLPRVYGKDLTAFEIASSGKIAISLNDIHTVDISRSNYVNSSNYKNSIVSQSNYSLGLQANGGDVDIMLDAYSNEMRLYAASNISLTADSGNMSFTAANDMTVTVSNNYTIQTLSNVTINAAKGTALITANNSNLYVKLDNTNNNLTTYSSNNTFISACNAFNLNANSNINVGALGGDFKAYSDQSNMYLTLEKSTDNATLYSLSNIFLTASNSTTITSSSNVSLSAANGSFVAYSDSSNMYLNMDKATDNVTIYSISNVTLVGSNNTSITSKSNVSIGALAGDFKAYANSSNMYLTMSSATNNVNLFASNNFTVSVSNNYNTQVKNSLTQSTVLGDYLLYVNSSNMFMRMSSTTNNVYLFGSNNTYIGASNSLSISAESNMTVSTSNGSIALAANSSNMYISLDAATNDLTEFASNNLLLIASNDLNVNSQSNIYVGALEGSFKTYAHGSNMYLTLDRTSDTVTLYTTSNIFVSASNNYNLQAKSNINVNSFAGDVRVYANNSNMSLVMSQSTNNVALSASNNLNLTASNTLNVNAQSNIYVGALGGDLKLYSKDSNMYLVMDSTTNNISEFASNNMTFSVSNSLSTSVNSNYNITTTAGDFNLSANNSNMYVRMAAATNNVSVFASNNLSIGVSNSMTTQIQSNLNISTTGGSYNLYVNNSNMYVNMDSATNNTTVFTSNNYQLSVSNILNINSKSNINVGAVSGDIRLYAYNSNMFLTMDKSVMNTTLFASNNIFIGASNTLQMNTSNSILMGALNGDFKVYSSSSNMYLTMDHTTNNIALFSSNDTVLNASNNFYVYTQSNVLVSANAGNLSLYANSSNVSVVLDKTSNNLLQYSSNSIKLTASNSYSVITRSNVCLSGTLGNVKIYSANSNMSLVMDAATLNTTLNTSNNLSLSASNNYYVNAQSNIYMGAFAGDFKAYADSSNMYLTMDRGTDVVSLYAQSNMNLTTSNTFDLTAKSNIYLGALAGDFKAYADGSNMYLSLDKTTDNISMYAVSNIALTASNTMNVNTKSNLYVGALAGDVKVYANSSNMHLTMAAATNDVSLYGLNNMTVLASNNYTMNAQVNASLNANTGTMNIYSSNNMVLSASNNLTSSARSNVTFDATAGSFVANANNSNMYLIMDQPTNNVTLYGLNNMNVTSSNSFTLNAQSNIVTNALNGNFNMYSSSNFTLNADSSNMYLNMSAPSDVINMYSLSNIYISASNNFKAEASSNISLIASNINLLSHRDIVITASNNMTITASNSLTLSFGSLNTSTSNDQSFQAQSNVFFYINSASNPAEPIFTVQNDKVMIRGDIIVTGDINTSNIFSTTVIQQSLKISDKELVVANVGSNFNPADGPFDGSATNSGAGLRIDGIPTGFDSNIPQAYDKTFQWNYGNSGIGGLGTAAGLSNESYWQLKGGSLKMTHQKIVPSGGSNIIQEVSFGFRVNELDELEFTKQFYYTPSNGYITKRIARFGRIL